MNSLMWERFMRSKGEARRSRMWLLAAAVMALVLVAAGCGGGQEATNGEPASQEPETQVEAPKLDPVTIKISGRGAFQTDEAMIKYVVDPVKAKYPHITVEIAPFRGGTAGMQELLVAGEVPDIIIPFYENLSLYVDLQVMEPLDDMIRKHQFDLSKVDPGAIATIKAMSDPDRLVALPLTTLPGALFYNKDLFDNFGVDYPEDGLMLQEAAELGKRLNRDHGGVRIIGFHAADMFRLHMQRNMPLLNPQTGRASVTTDAWQEAFRDLKAAFDGQNIPDDLLDHGKARNAFDNGQIAMLISSSSQIASSTRAGINWDVATLPQSPTHPGYGWRADGNLGFVSTTSKHKDDAFLVLSHILSPEVQMEMSRDQIISPLANTQIQEAFGANMPEMQNKNISAFFALQTPAGVPQPPFNLSGPLRRYGVHVVKNEMDINTAARTFEEEFNRLLDQAAAAN